MKRVGEQAARAWLTAGTRVAQALAEGQAAGATSNAAGAGRPHPSQGAGPPRRPSTGAGSVTLAAPSGSAQSTHRAQLGLAALRAQAQQRASHSHASGASAAIAAELAKIDAAFSGRASPARLQAALEAIDRADIDLSQMQAPDLSPQDRLAQREARMASLAFLNDAAPLVDAVISGEVHSMASLDEVAADQLNRERVDALRTSPPGLEPCGLSADENMALGLYSAREDLNLLPIGRGVFRAVNTAMRMDKPEAKDKLQFLIDPLTSGMQKLPAADGQTVYRGLLVADPDDKDALAVLQQQLQSGQELTLPAFTSASQGSGYPGNLLFVMKSADEDSQLRDTSKFNYVEAQQERTFLPGTRFRIASSELSSVPKHYGEHDARVESSGRTWSERVGKPLLVVTLEEVPADERTKP